jgi:hypothetical protein
LGKAGSRPEGAPRESALLDMSQATPVQPYEEGSSGSYADCDSAIVAHWDVGESGSMAIEERPNDVPTA